MRASHDQLPIPQSPIQSTANGSSNGNVAPLSPIAAIKATNGMSSTSASTNGHANGDSNGAVGRAIADNETWQGHNKKEVTRILIQTLSDLGFPQAAAQLSQESGLELERPHIARFRRAVLEGDWAEAESILFGSPDSGGGPFSANDSTSSLSLSKSASNGASNRLHGLALAPHANPQEMRFLLRQQKYLELLEKRDLSGALTTLRSGLTPLGYDQVRLNHLSSLMMCTTPQQLYQDASWDGAEGSARSSLLSELSRCISPAVMLPEARLGSLLAQAKENWVDACLYHNTTDPPSLVTDHLCPRSSFPTEPLIELRHHQDEVWFLAFSPDGRYLATAGKDQAVFVYETRDWSVRHQWLNRHKSGVCYLAWSPDSRRLVSTAREGDNSAVVSDVETGAILQQYSTFTYAVTAAAFDPRPLHSHGSPGHENCISGAGGGSCGWLILASLDVDCPLSWYDAHTHERLFVYKEENMRIFDIAVSPDGSRLVVLVDGKILIFDPRNRQKVAEWPANDGRMTSVQISQDSRHMLIHTEKRIKLLLIDTGEEVRSFEGHVQTEFMIRSAFGGAGESFVVSGSEDSKVIVWKTNGTVVEEWEAHRGGCVNTIAWHPSNPGLFASAGDDGVVRVWASMDYIAEQPERTLPGQTQAGNGYGRYYCPRIAAVANYRPISIWAKELSSDGGICNKPKSGIHFHDSPLQVPLPEPGQFAGMHIGNPEEEDPEVAALLIQALYDAALAMEQPREAIREQDAVTTEHEVGSDGDGENVVGEGGGSADGRAGGLEGSEASHEE